MTVWIAPGGASHVALYWDGDQVADVDLVTGWNAIRFDREHVAVGEHELAIEAAPAISREAGLPSDPDVPVGVAISAVDIALLPPK